MPKSKLRAAKVGSIALSGTGLLCGAYVPAGAATTTTLLAGGPTAGPNLLNNGSFTLPAAEANGATPADGKTIAGWTVGGTGLQVYSRSGQGIEPPPGATFMVKLGEGNLTQTVKTTAGWTYLLQWYESGYPGYGPPEFKSINWTKRTAVTWGGKLVATPSFNAEPNTLANMRWALRREVLTATSAATTLEFSDATKQQPSGYSAMVGRVSLAGDAKLYLPPTATVAPTGRVLAIVRTATGAPLVDPNMTVKMYGTWKETSYAPPSTQLMASGKVLNGQVSLHLSLHAAMAGHTIPAYVVLSAPGFIPVTQHLTIKVS